MTVQDNTIVDSYWGVLLTNSEKGSYSGGANYNMSRNVTVGAKGNPDVSYGGCLSSCMFDYNVTDDESAQQARLDSFCNPSGISVARHELGPRHSLCRAVRSDLRCTPYPPAAERHASVGA